MKKWITVFVGLLATLFIVNTNGAMAASGKCKVVKVDGARMVIECNDQAKGFAEGNNIKIKTDRKNKKKKS